MSTPTEAGRKKRYSPTGEERAKIAAAAVEAYNRKTEPKPSIRSVAENLGQTYSLTHRLLLEAGALRAKTGQPAG